MDLFSGIVGVMLVLALALTAGLVVAVYHLVAQFFS
jgi:hypothetical protein